MSIKLLKNIEINEYNYDYNGMVSNKTNLPHGYGRAIGTDKVNFVDGHFKDGVPHGYCKVFFKDGFCDNNEFADGTLVRDWQ